MRYSSVPPTLYRYNVPAQVLEDTRTFLRCRGEEGVEAVVLWLGYARSDRDAEIVTAYVPEQIAYISDDGLAVEVTASGLTALISALPAGIFVLCRVHSHPGPAFHSELDDENMIISHPGAISIVVPNFARVLDSLECCSVNELQHNSGWKELPSDEVRDRFVIR